MIAGQAVGFEELGLHPRSAICLRVSHAGQSKPSIPVMGPRRRWGYAKPVSEFSGPRRHLTSTTPRMPAS